MKFNIVATLLALSKAQMSDESVTSANTCDANNFNCDVDHYCYSANDKAGLSDPLFFCSSYWVDFASQ